MKKKLLSNKVFNYFGFQNQSKLFSSTMLVLSLFCFSDGFSQTQRIPLSDGSFNSGNTFAANGWTLANEGTSPVKWALGTAASGTTSIGTTTGGSAAVTLAAANANITVGQIVYGAGIPTNTFVQSIAGTSLTLSQNATGSSTGTFGFSASSGSMSVGASQLTTASIAATTFTVTMSAANPNVSVGMAIAPIAGVIAANTYVASVNGTAIGLSKATLNASALAVAQNLVFTATSSAITGNAAYISNDNGSTNSYGGYSSNRTVSFYRDITTIPASEKAMTLTFDVKSAPSSSAGWQVWVAPITQNVVGSDTQVSTAFNYSATWPGATLISFNSYPEVAATKITAFVPKSFAGTSFRLIFVWTNNTSTGTLPPASIDNISLTSRVAEDIICTQSGLWSLPATWTDGKVPTPADNAILLNSNDVVIIDSRFSGCEDLQLIGANTLVQFAISNIIDDFTVNNDLNLAGSGSRFNNHDGTTNAKHLKLGHNLDVSPGARFDSSLGGTTIYQGRLTLNGSAVQTITVDPAGFVGGSATGVNAFANVSGVLNQIEVTNTATANSNVNWNANGVRIKSAFNLITGRINITGTNRIVIGNFSASNNMIINPGSGITNGTLSKYMSGANTKPVQPGTEYPGTDNNYKPFWYPFISSTGLDRSVYFMPDANPATASEVAITYTNVNTTTNALSIADGSYTITDRYNGNWAFSTPDASVTGTPLVYAPNATTLTNRVGIIAKGAFEAIDGSARIMNSSAALSGVHQDGTNKPFAFRKDIPFVDLTTAPIYIGVNVGSIINTATAITSATSGDWNMPTTWVGGVVPACGNIVNIAAGHNITVTTAANAAGVVIAKNGTLTNNTGGVMTVGCTNNNAAFFNYGTYTMSAGTLTVNGSIAHKTGSFFNQTGGDIIVDSNNNGDVATSVAFGGSSIKIETSDLDLTGGKITIVDPLVNIGGAINGQSAANFTVNTEGATGTFTAPGAISASTLSSINIQNGFGNIFDIGYVVSGNANIVAGTTITNVATNFFGAVTLTLSQPATAAVPSGTSLTFSSMINSVSSLVIEENAVNANLAVGMGISGVGIPANTTITDIKTSSGFGTTGTFKLSLSNPVTGLATSPITSVQTLQITVVSPGASSVILSAVNPDIVEGMSVSGLGILPGTFVVSVSDANVTLSQPIQPGAPSPLNVSFQSFNTQTSGSFIYDSANHYAAGLNHTLQIGDGVSVENSALVTNGFNCQFQASGGLLSIGNLTIDAPDGNNRFMNVGSNNINNGYNMNVQNALTVTTGSVFKKTFSNATVYVGGNIVNNGTINFPKGGTNLYLGNFINGAVAPTSLPQTISGSGTFDANQYYLANNTYTAGVSLSQLTINNTSTQGVTLTVPNFRILSGFTLVNGILHTSAATPILIGDPNVLTSTSFVSIATGSDTSYIDGPMVYAFNSTANTAQYRLLPLGKNGKFLPIYMANTGGVQITAEAFDSNTGSANATNISNLSTDRWKISQFGTEGSITGYNIKMASTSINSTSLIAHSATENGVYDVVSSPVSAMTNVNATATIPNAIQLATVQTGGFLGNFAYAQGPACTGAPAPGATIASTTSVCSGMAVSLSLTTPTTGASVTYQWQVSTNGGTTWTNIVGATSNTYVAIPLVDSSYLCNVTCGSTTVASTQVAVTTSMPTAVTTGASICTAGTVNLTASGSPILNWYDAATGGNLVATGTAYSPSLTTTTSFYVASASESSNTANTATYTGTSTSTAIYRGIAFDVTKKIRLNSVKIYPKNTTLLTPITVSLYDANGTIVEGTSPVTFTPTLVTGTVGTVSQVVSLNYTIPSGTGYRLVATNGLVSTTNTLGNSTAAIVYPLTSGSLILTGNVTSLNSAIATTSNTTSCFHNLTYDEICESSTRVEVIATVVNTPAPAGAATQDSCGTGTIAEFSVTGTGLIWYSHATANNVIPTTTTAVLNTTYYVSQTISGCEGPRLAILANGSCLSTDSFAITNLSYYPNPVTDLLTINAKEIITRVEVYNLIGQQVKVLNTDTENVQLNIGELAASTYLIKVYADQKVQSLKVIKK